MPKLLLEATHLRHSFGMRTVIDVDSLCIYDGERIGLIGENGAGKSTLLAILAGELVPDEGTVRRDGEAAVIHQGGDAGGADDAGVRARFAAQEGGHALSGGEYTRRRIAAALSAKSRLLFADEPTTDLDADGVAQLRRELARYRGAIVLVSHDRELLDALCTRILHLEDAKLTDFPGNYSDYRAELERRRAFQRFEYEQYRGEQARLRASIQGNRERASQMKKAPSRMGNSEARLHRMDSRQTSEQLHKARRQLESRLERLEVRERPREDVEIRMALGARTPIPAKNALEARRLALKAGDKRLLSNAAFALPVGSRTALLGSNGCGKTTLMRAIAARAAASGQLCGGADGGADGGSAIRLHPAARVGWFDQTHERTLDFSRTTLENVLLGCAHAESDARTVLARLALRGDDVFKPVGVLSGGERGRVALAKLLLSDANVLLLDEPTNHLDVFTLEALESLLAGYRGTVLFASHDMAFVDRAATRLMRFEQRSLASFEGTRAEWLERERADRGAEARALEQAALEMRMAEIAARIALPKKGDDLARLDAEYRSLGEQLRALRE